ncbi:hypothetical protein EMIT0P100_270006 [Pseudomonas sp. IT-P100]
MFVFITIENIALRLYQLAETSFSTLIYGRVCSR